MGGEGALTNVGVDPIPWVRVASRAPFRKNEETTAVPIYEYRHLTAAAPCAETFERIESLSAPPLEQCPDCGAPVERVPASFQAHRNVLAHSRLKEHGFTKLTRRDKGVYERS